jgi:hypothetical protein
LQVCILLRRWRPQTYSRISPDGEVLQMSFPSFFREIVRSTSLVNHYDGSKESNSSISVVDCCIVHNSENADAMYAPASKPSSSYEQEGRVSSTVDEQVHTNSKFYDLTQVLGQSPRATPATNTWRHQAPSALDHPTTIAKLNPTANFATTSRHTHPLTQDIHFFALPHTHKMAPATASVCTSPLCCPLG